MRPYGAKDTVLIYKLKKLIPGTLLLMMVCLITLCLFSWLEKYDNKYTHRSIQPQKGVLTIDDKTFSDGKYICVIDDWEFYHGSVAANKNSYENPQYVFIGQYSNYSLREKEKSSFGDACYRLVIENKGAQKVLSMEIPELFSSSRVYINGELVSSLGNVGKESYKKKIQNQIISFAAEGRTELIFEISNYDHYYSGLFYPPILGTAKTVTGIVIERLTLYGVLAFSTLSIALFSIAVWNQRRKNVLYYNIYGVLSFSFGVHVLYPFVRWMGIPFIKSMYAVEDVSEYLMILCVILISTIIAGQERKKYFKQIVFPIAVLMCAVSFFIPMFLLPYKPGFLPFYGFTIESYQTAVSIYILLMSYLAIYRGIRGSYLLLVGNVLFSVGVLKDVFTSNLFEPVRGGWLKEYTGFFMVIIFAILMQYYFRMIMKDNLKLTEHLEHEVEIRTKELTTLLQERKKLLSEAAHDLKAPVSSIQTFIEFMKMGNVQIDEETKSYLMAIEQKSREVQNRVVNLQQLSMDEYLAEKKERVCLNDFLQEIYENNLPDSNANGIYLKIHLPPKKIFMEVDRDKMTRAIENIIYNAFDFTPIEGSIKIDMKWEDEIIRLTITDTGRGIEKEDIEYIFNREYTRRFGKERPGKGLGLYIAKKIIEAHNGKIEVVSEIGKGSSFIITFLGRQR